MNVLRLFLAFLGMCIPFNNETLDYYGNPFMKSFMTGRWIHSDERTINEKTPYLKISNTSVYAIRQNTRVSMDISDFLCTENNTIHFRMHNFQMHSSPLYVSVSDYKILPFVYIVMKHGVDIKCIMSEEDKKVGIFWTIRHEKTNDVLHHGHFELLNLHLPHD